MSKFICEVDTDAKTITFKKDDVVMDVDEASIGFYEYQDCCSYPPSKKITRCYGTFTKSNADSTSLTNGFCFSKESESDIASMSSIAGEIGKIINRVVGMNQLKKALAKKD